MPKKINIESQQSNWNIIDHLLLQRRPKVLHKEYASYRNDIVRYFVDEILPTEKVLVDPMAGTAPLLPYVEYFGMTAFFNDILPIHAYINEAKTYRVYRALQSATCKDSGFLKRELKFCFSGIKNHNLRISDKWIPDDLLDGMLSAWAKTQTYQEPICTFFRAAIILSARYLGSFSQSLKNNTWYKAGGMSSEKSLTQIIQEILNRFERYYNTYYRDWQDMPGGRIIFSSEDVAQEPIKWKTNLILTSPSFPNRFDYVTMFAPELYFLSFADNSYDLTRLKEDILASNIVRDCQYPDDNLDLILKNAPKTAQFLRDIESKERKVKGRKGENRYYFRYFMKYYLGLFTIIDNLLKSFDNTGSLYLILQNNVHRGELNDMEAYVSEYCTLKEFCVENVFRKSRIHQGRRNISADHPLVIKKQQESIVKVTKC